MKTLMFKTNIKDAADTSQVSSFLDRIDSIKNWEVDTRSTMKTLTVRGRELQLTSISRAVKKAGFECKALTSAVAKS